jgi:hypothetical protein
MPIMGIAGNTYSFCIDGATAEVENVMAINPRRIAKIKIVLNFLPNNYSKRKKAFIRFAANEFMIVKSLYSDLGQEIIFNFE